MWASALHKHSYMCSCVHTQREIHTYRNAHTQSHMHTHTQRQFTHAHTERQMHTQKSVHTWEELQLAVLSEVRDTIVVRSSFGQQSKPTFG